MNIDSKVENGIGWLLLSRPEQLNALTVPLLKEALEQLKVMSSQADVRCLVISGQGRIFCAGADLAEWEQAEADNTLETYGWSEAAHELMVELYNFPKPMIAALNGSVVGAGLDLSLCCDFRYAVPKAKFIPGYTSMAYCPDGGISWHLPRLIGVEQAKHFLFFDKPWTAEKALSTGLITGIFEADIFQDEIEKLARQLAAGATFAFTKTKELLKQSSKNNLQQQLLLEKAAGLECGRTSDAKEALVAVAEKRNPNFSGR